MSVIFMLIKVCIIPSKSTGSNSTSSSQGMQSMDKNTLHLEKEMQTNILLPLSIDQVMQ